MVRNRELQCGATGEARRSLKDARPSAVDAPRRARGFVHRADWLQEHCPDAKLPDVGRQVNLADRAGIETRDWSLTPSRCVSVAPGEEDEDFDFEEALWAIHIDTERPNEDAAELAAPITRNREEKGA